MNDLFLKLINMSISASWLVLAVLLLRLVWRKAPKWTRVLLWGIVAARLICPFSFESAFSLVPSAETIPLNIGLDTTPAINSGISAINSVVNPIISQSNTPLAGASINPLQITIAIFEYVWIFGVAALTFYTAVSYWGLRRKVRTAVRCRDNIYQSECVSSPFVLGIIKPKIYLPFRVDEADMEAVVAHEQSHIQRKDHWWKPLGFLLLTIHWFNPLMWLAYVLLCRDIELACDEKVIRDLNGEQRADYTKALLTCSVNRRQIAACPLAFGEIGVKERVRAVMSYKKPAFWVILVSVLLCAALAVCFLTDPKDSNYSLRIYVPGGGRGVFYTDEEISPLGGSVTVSCGEGLGDTQVFLRPVTARTSAGENVAYMTPGLKTTLEGEKGSWYQVGVQIENTSADGITVWVNVENVEVRIQEASSGETVWFEAETGVDDLMSGGETVYATKHSSFPGVTFLVDRGQITAKTAFDGETLTADGSPLEAYTVLLTGMPIWNVYFQDITGDGLPEICVYSSYGSGLVDTRVQVCDYANGRNYTLADRGNYDYSLRRDEDTGELYVDQRPFGGNGSLLQTGRLALENGVLVMAEPSAVKEMEFTPMVMIGGKLYMDSGRKSDIDGRCGVMDGQITSSVAPEQRPTADDQSNFGTGLDYQIGAEPGTVEIFMNEAWEIFVPVEAGKGEAGTAAETDASGNRYWMTVGMEGVAYIEFSLPNASFGCMHANESPYKKGERFWIEGLDGREDLQGLTITAYNQAEQVIFHTAIPEGAGNQGFTRLTIDDWTITDQE